MLMHLALRQLCVHYPGRPRPAVDAVTLGLEAGDIGVPTHARLGKQARDDGAHDSDNVLGDVMEALLGANFLEAGFGPTEELVHRLWRSAVEGRPG